MRRILSVAVLLMLAGQVFAENKIKAELYGFVRGAAYLDSRRNVASQEGLQLLYPMDVSRDAVGRDLNKVPSQGFYAFNSRMGLDIKGLNALNADITGRIEGDFAGFGTTNSVLRIRQAFVKMSWNRSDLTIGQAWHPMHGPVIPGVISIATGAPFNPFNRSPQIRYDYRIGKTTLSGAAIWQFQTVSSGPDGKSSSYQKNALLPELFAGADYSRGGFTLGASVSCLTLKPRTSSTVGGDVFRVDESISSFAYSLYTRYRHDMLTASLKTIYGGNLSHLSMLGGYGVSGADAATGRRDYTGVRHSTSWIGLDYGKKYKGGVFGGYSRNLGSDKPLAEGSALYGEGMNINELYRLCAIFTYNIPGLVIGVEYEMTQANYGNPETFDYARGKYRDSHPVANHRIGGVITYFF